MFEIMNNMIKEMKAIQQRSNSTPSAPSMSGGFPIDLLSMLGAGGGFSQNLGAYQEEEDEDEEEPEFTKIVVSDTEVEEELDDENVKVIHIDMAEEHVNSEDLPDLEEEVDTEGDVEVESEADAEVEVELKDDDTKESLDKSSDDYRKMDISYLRTLVLTRGLASDTKKLKKADLVKLLSE
jgi:hypothetical protein